MQAKAVDFRADIRFHAVLAHDIPVNVRLDRASRVSSVRLSLRGRKGLLRSAVWAARPKYCSMSRCASACTGINLICRAWPEVRLAVAALQVADAQAAEFVAAHPVIQKRGQDGPGAQALGRGRFRYRLFTPPVSKHRSPMELFSFHLPMCRARRPLPVV
jgi:hypothetical protein